MIKRKGTAKKNGTSELKALDLLPREEGLKRTDDLLRTMLNSPPDPFTPKARAKPKKRAK